MFVSVKLRQSGFGSEMGRTRPSVMMYNYEKAEAVYAEWQEAVRRSATEELSTELVEQVAPPSPAVRELDIEPVHVSSPSVFWIQYGEGAAEKADRLQEILASSVGALNRVAGAGRVGRGELYIAPYMEPGEEEPCFYRARVEAVQGEMVTVFFIDYGNLASMPASCLLVVSGRLLQDHPDMVRIPGLALECRLAGLQPSRIRNSKGLWDEEAVDKFKQLLQEAAAEGRLVGSIYSVTRSGAGHSKFVVALDKLALRSHGAEEREVREELLVAGLGEAASEDIRSQQNHEEREKYSAYHRAMQVHLDNYAKYEPRAAKFRPEAGQQQLTVKQPLTGPYSPLEHKVICLHRHGATKMASVEQDSVNSVLLNQSPGDSYDQYLVAAHVGMNPSGETLQLRNTSWLPARPGLGALATMMFSPQVSVQSL